MGKIPFVWILPGDFVCFFKIRDIPETTFLGFSTPKIERISDRGIQSDELFLGKVVFLFFSSEEVVFSVKSMLFFLFCFLFLTNCVVFVVFS